MNKERLIELADKIEKLEHYLRVDEDSRINKEQFSMVTYYGKTAEGCNTPACIAGWAVYLYDKDFDEAVRETDGFLSERAYRLLGVSPEDKEYQDLQELFHPSNVLWRMITPAQAAEATRAVANGTFVSWKYIIGDHADE